MSLIMQIKRRELNNALAEIVAQATVAAHPLANRAVIESALLGVRIDLETALRTITLMDGYEMALDVRGTPEVAHG